MRLFAQFVALQKQKQHHKRLKLNVQLFVKYGQWRFNTTGVSGDTIGNDISGINSYLHDFGHGLNLNNHAPDPLVRLKKGVDVIRAKYHIGQRRVLRRALTDQILDPMIKFMSTNDNFTLVIKACLLVAKHAGLRAHNYVQTNKGGNIRMKHLRFHPTVHHCKKVVITIPYSKTNQPGKLLHEVRTVKCRCSIGPCPVHELAKICRHRSNSSSEPVFMFNNGVALDYSIFSKMLKILCEEFDLDPRYYTSHALRIGEATDCHQKGMTLPQIMKKLNWTSRRTAMKYIRPENPDLDKFE